ncbi:MAG: SEC-C metal-binding domain-containing protein [Allosphingosinicella sp.]
MQVTQGAYGTRIEFFEGGPGVTGRMDQRLGELHRKGETLVRRAKIGRNTTCPCGSGLKFKKCCIAKLR